MKLSLVVPCYNEESVLPLFATRVQQVEPLLSAYTLEYLFVDDGSRDGTLSFLHDLQKKDDRVRVLSFSRNFGKEAAMHAGLAHATGDLVAIMDADLQDPPELLPDMVALLEREHCDCVATQRVTRHGEPPIRSLFARLFYKLLAAFAEVPVKDGVRDFRLMKRSMVDAILTLPERRRFSKGLFAWVGFQVRYIEYDNIARAAGDTKWSFGKLFSYAVEGIVSMTTAPLYLSGVLGLGCVLTAVILWLCGQGLAGLLCFASALMLGTICLVGAYIARILWEVKKRPLYILKHPADGTRIE